MLLHKSVEHDSRVRREAKALAAAGHEVTVVHLPRKRHADEFRLDGFRVVCATPASWLRRALPFHAYRVAFLPAFVRHAVRLRPEVVHAHDAPMLAPGLLAARLGRAKLVYDSHELATGVPYREPFWGHLVSALERVALPRCAAVLTVSQGISDRLNSLYGLRECPAVVRNLPDTDGAVEGVANLREQLRIGSAPLVLHQGALAPGRGCETLVEAVAHLPGTHLVFLGDSWPGYDRVVERFARATAAADRIHFLPSVPVHEVLRHTRAADVGVSLLNDDCDNHRLALPNKVFEYIVARIPVVASDLPELRRLIEEHQVGCTVNSTDALALAQAISRAIAARDQTRATLAAAADQLTWASEAPRLLAVYERLNASGDRPRALVLVRNTITYDARVLRESRLLDMLGYDTTVVGVVSTHEQEREAMSGRVRLLRIPAGSRPRLFRSGKRPVRDASPSAAGAAGLRGAGGRHNRKQRFRRLAVTLDWYRRGITTACRMRPTLVHCNDYNTMWIGVVAKLGGARLIYDSHELWPDRNLRPEPRWWLMLCEALFVRVADEVITTSPGYADVIGRRYRTRRPLVVRNIPERPAFSARVTDGNPVALYFGAVTRNRGLEEAVVALKAVPGLRLRVIGPEAWGFAGELESLAERIGVGERVEVLGPVSPERTFDVLREADLGLALIQPTCLSYRLTLPNKLFEYAMAGVPILASDVPVLANFVRQHELGLIVRPGDAASVAHGMSQLLDPDLQARFGKAASELARTISWESEGSVLAGAYGGPPIGAPAPDR